MGAAAGYYRHPTIHGDRVVFVADDDLWTVPVEGGIARRLTAGRGTATFPRFSPDGRTIAFTSTDEGSPDACLMPAEGGAVRRLTFTGAAITRTVGWTPDGRRVIFHSNWLRPFAWDVHLHEIPAEGGRAHRLPWGPAREIAHEPGGAGVVLGIHSGDPARWKRYRGGTAGTIWVDRKGTGDFEPLLRLDGNFASPMWIGSRIYFLSDHEGHGNLYSCTPTGRSVRRHTHHEDHYARFPSTDGERIVYHAGADLHVLDVREDAARRVEVELASPRTQRRRRFCEVATHLESASLHPEGHSVAAVARGSAHVMGLWAGAPSVHGRPSSERWRLAAWLADGERLVAVTDAGGEEELVVAPVHGSGAPRRLGGGFGRAVDLLPSPTDPTRLALTNHRQEVLIADLKSKEVSVVEASRHGRVAGLAWSPDGRWLAYGFPATRRTSCLHLLDVRSGEVHEITRPDFVDLRPSFDPQGRYLYFLSRRVFDPVYDNQYFDLGFPRGMRPHLLTLRADLPSPFSTTARVPQPPRSEPRSDESEPPQPADDVKVDLEGIADRIVPFPVEEAIYERVLGAPGRVFLTSLGVEGSLGQSWADQGEPSANALLEVYDFEKDKVETVLDGVTDVRLSGNARVLLVRVGNALRVLPAGLDPKDLPTGDEPDRETGWLDLTRLRVEVAPGDEWTQMLKEAWRLQRDHFWTPDMSRVDWTSVLGRYLPLVDRIATRAEFSDLAWEMQGELGTSHCYELGGDYRPEPDWYQGFLGADLEWSASDESWTIARIPRGDSWEAEAASPLAAPGLGIAPGDRLLAVAGRSLSAVVSPHECLVDRAGRDVVLRVAREGGKPRDVAVRTLETEMPLRYRDWVESNRELVHRKTRGRVGYVHVPNMGPQGYAEFHRYFRSEMDHPGLIIDVRWNGGGHVSQLLLEKLLRRRVGWDAGRWQEPEPYPAESPVGPMVALTNECAGSDGDIFSHCFKLYGLGPLIGKRTWGGVVGIWPRHSLVDGTVTTQPEFSFWFEDVGWGVENHGAEPDLVVDIRPQDHAAGRDTQVEAGIEEILRILAREKPSQPKLGKRPRLRPPRLPKDR